MTIADFEKFQFEQLREPTYPKIDYDHCPACKGALITIANLIYTTAEGVWVSKTVCINPKTTGCLC